MPTYVSLLRYTQQGIERVKQSPVRAEEAKKSWEAMGVRIRHIFWVMGQYDAVIIAEAPNDEAAVKAALAQAASGSIRTETMRAFTEEEFKRMVEALP